MTPSDLERGSDPASPTPSDGPGALLLTERRNQGLSLGDIARQLKLSVRQVEALERDEYDSFQGSVFVRGFLRNYARLLGLNPDRLVEAAGASAAPPVAHAEPGAQEQRVAPTPERRLRALTWGGFAALATLVVILLASNASKEQQRAGHLAREASPTVPPAALPQAESAAPAEQTPEASAQAPAASAAPAERKPAVADSPSGTVASAQPAESGAGAVRTPASDWPRTGTSPAEEDAAPATSRVLVVGTGPGRIRMIFADESWVEVRDGSGTTIFSRLNAPGTERVVRGLPPFDVVVGNAHRVKLLYEDKPIDLGPHTRVDVARITLE
jgi:cytoskeleton protein RodZ